MSTNNRRVVITGLGTVNPIGNTVTEFWGNIKAGKSGVGKVTRYDVTNMDAKIAAEVKNFDPSIWMEKKDARKMAYFTQYAVASAVQAWQDAKLTEESYDSYKIGVYLGNGIGGVETIQDAIKKMYDIGPMRIPPLTVPVMIINEAAGNIAIRLKIHGPAITIATACASGTDAIGQAFEAIRNGKVECALAGGTEAAITQFGMAGFCVLKALSTKYNDTPEKASRPFDKNRDGFVMGEGAGVLVLETYENALKRGATIYAEVAGYGATCDAYHLTSPDPEGTAGAEAIKIALADANLTPTEIDYYNAHGTSTEINDPTETRMIKKAFGDHAYKMKISSTKGMTGHLVAAAGAVEAIICTMALKDSYYPATINLDECDPDCDLDYIPNKGIEKEMNACASGSLGFGGHNGILVFKKVKA